MATLDKTSRDRAEPLSQATEKRRFRSEQLIRYLPLILLAIIIVVVGLIAPNFLTARNAINILRQSSALGLMAIGMTAVLIGGGIDLSIPSVMALSGILGAMFKDSGSPYAWTTVVQVPTEWNPEKFLTGTTDALTAYPDANCMFVASYFAFDSVMQALEAAGKAIPSGEEGHIWIAAQDVNPQGYTAMEEGIIDVATTYDAYFHAVEFVNALLRVASGEELGVKKVLVPGRVATLENFKELPNMWALDYRE